MELKNKSTVTYLKFCTTVAADYRKTLLLLYDNLRLHVVGITQEKSPQTTLKAELYGSNIMLCLLWDPRNFIHLALLKRYEFLNAHS